MPLLEADVAQAADPRPVPPLRARYFLFGEMLLFATLSLVASFVLSYDALLLAADPDVDLSCSINAVLDCAKVGVTWQAKVFASLWRTRFPKWFMFTANAVYLLGVIFAYWLLFQSTFVIGALCPWCILVTVSTTFVFWSMTQWNILEGNLYLSPKWQERALAFQRGGWMTITLMAWLAVVVLIEVLKWGLGIF
jgi:uncharacterized membrane protein